MHRRAGLTAAESCSDRHAKIVRSLNCLRDWCRLSRRPRSRRTVRASQVRGGHDRYGAHRPRVRISGLHDSRPEGVFWSIGTYEGEEPCSTRSWVRWSNLRSQNDYPVCSTTSFARELRHFPAWVRIRYSVIDCMATTTTATTVTVNTPGILLPIIAQNAITKAIAAIRSGATP